MRQHSCGDHDEAEGRERIARARGVITDQSINQSNFICIAPYNSQKVHKVLSSKSINRQQKKGEEQNKTQK